jgi:hypothetical protein
MTLTFGLSVLSSGCFLVGYDARAVERRRAQHCSFQLSLTTAASGSGRLFFSQIDPAWPKPQVIQRLVAKNRFRIKREVQ